MAVVVPSHLAVADLGNIHWAWAGADRIHFAEVSTQEVENLRQEDIEIPMVAARYWEIAKTLFENAPTLGGPLLKSSYGIVQQAVALRKYC